MSGLWVFVCGPSGAGKDSVMGWAATQLAARQDIVFARRMVTRPALPGSDHDPVTVQQFQHSITTGGLVWRWEAHGFHYGIEARYAAQVAAGGAFIDLQAALRRRQDALRPVRPTHPMLTITRAPAPQR